MTIDAEPPRDEEVERGIAAIEQYLRDQASTTPAKHTPATSGDEDTPADAEDDDPAGEETGAVEPYRPTPIVLPDGETRRVKALAWEVAEARRILALQGAPEPLLVETNRVRRRRKKVIEAARLHALDQDPIARAYRDQRVRRVITWMVMGAAGIALAASSIGVQASVVRALGIDHGTPGWWAAYLVEPALSLPLLAAVAVQAYSAIRGKVVDRKSPEGRRMFRVEALLLALTLILNCWPAVVTPDGGLTFDPLAVIVHALGPVAAVTAVWVLPTLWAVLATLPTPEVPSTLTTPLTGGLTPFPYRENAPAAPAPQAPARRSSGADIDALTERARRMVRTGELPPRPSAHRIRAALGVGMDTARAVRDRLAQDGGAS